MNLPALLTEYARGLTHLLLPQLCAGCGRPLLLAERVLCMACQLCLPRTEFHDIPDNEAALRIAGRIPYQHATAFALFAPEGLMQHLMHLLKYGGRKDVGRFLGRQAGQSLKAASWAATLDAVLPVPLHPKKEAARGFNQSALIAEGIGEVLGLEVFPRALLRSRHTESQTKKSREERALNVAGAFRLAPGIDLPGRHVLLVDDVLTTGATLEAASVPLLKVPGLRLSIMTVGLAVD